MFVPPDVAAPSRPEPEHRLPLEDPGFSVGVPRRSTLVIAPIGDDRRQTLRRPHLWLRATRARAPTVGLRRGGVGVGAGAGGVWASGLSSLRARLPSRTGPRARAEAAAQRQTGPGSGIGDVVRCPWRGAGRLARWPRSMVPGPRAQREGGECGPLQSRIMAMCPQTARHRARRDSCRTISNSGRSEVASPTYSHAIVRSCRTTNVAGTAKFSPAIFTPNCVITSAGGSLSRGNPISSRVASAAPSWGLSVEIAARPIPSAVSASCCSAMSPNWRRQCSHQCPR